MSDPTFEWITEIHFYEGVRKASDELNAKGHVKMIKAVFFIRKPKSRSGKVAIWDTNKQDWTRIQWKQAGQSTQISQAINLQKSTKKSSGTQNSYEINCEGLKVTESLNFSRRRGEEAAEIINEYWWRSFHLPGLWVTNPSPPWDGTAVPALPARTKDTGTRAGIPAWIQILAPFLKQVDVLECTQRKMTA